MGAHLHRSLPHPEEVFLQHRVGLHLPPRLIPHTHPPAQGQGHKPEGKGDRTQENSNERDVTIARGNGGNLRLRQASSVCMVQIYRTEGVEAHSQNAHAGRKFSTTSLSHGPRANLGKETNIIFRLGIFRPTHREPRFLHPSSTRTKSSES